MSDYVKRFCNTFLVEGIFVLIVGLMLLILPQISTFAMSLMISVALILTGLYKLISTVVRRDEADKFWLNTLIAVLMTAAGVYLTIRPLFNVFMLTIALGLYFVLEGANSMITAFENRGIFKQWWVGLVAGLFQFALAFLILFGLPSTALYTIGILVGVSMLLSGITMLSVYTGSGCRRYSKI